MMGNLNLREIIGGLASENGTNDDGEGEARAGKMR
jgi:hypothetical protein